MKPKVSVIMPSLNVADYIDECLSSVLAQTLQNIEVICIDAESEDGTFEILQEYQKRDVRVKVLRSNIKSYGAQVNQGLKVAQGEYISIVETDDYIELSMFEILTDLADKYQVDYVKADFDSFCVLKNGMKLFDRFRLFKTEDSLYDKVINPSMYNHLYIYDFNLWKGIYRRSFLNSCDNLINPSKGAAYQDIGFTETVLANAKRAYYTKQSLYRYRVGRLGASCGSLNGLNYICEEFSRLLELDKMSSFITNREGFLLHLVTAYIGEVKGYLKKSKSEICDESIVTACEWIRHEIVKAIDKKELSIGSIPSEFRMDFDLIMSSLDAFSKEFLKEELAKQKQLLDLKLHNQKVVIYGAGKKGQHILSELESEGIQVAAFADNKILQTEVLGIKVFPIEDCIRLFGDAIYLVASATKTNEMLKMYIDAGGNVANCVNEWKC